eukprot:4554571-Pleurochrysis_carterae.AAC.3
MGRAMKMRKRAREGKTEVGALIKRRRGRFAAEEGRAGPQEREASKLRAKEPRKRKVLAVAA